MRGSNTMRPDSPAIVVTTSCAVFIEQIAYFFAEFVLLVKQDRKELMKDFPLSERLSLHAACQPAGKQSYFQPIEIIK